MKWQLDSCVTECVDLTPKVTEKMKGSLLSIRERILPGCCPGRKQETSQTRAQMKPHLDSQHFSFSGQSMSFLQEAGHSIRIWKGNSGHCPFFSTNMQAFLQSVLVRKLFAFPRHPLYRKALHWCF